MINVEHVSKYFGDKQALRDISFNIQQGDYVALIGINGAGKTTLIRILSTLTKATSGHVTINGISTKKDPQSVRKQIGIVSHYTFLYDELSAEENLKFYAKMYLVENARQRIDDLLDQVNLSSRRYDLVRTFSRGMQQRLALARAILHQPKILLLDEPFSGLDVNASEMLNGLLEHFIQKDSTVLITTHDINFARSTAHRILAIKDGIIVADAASAESSFERIKSILKTEEHNS
jgi:heme exporter protein A